MKTITLANPRGFCAGVDRAISIVEQALQIYGAPVYVRHEVVHNRYVVDQLRAKGTVFVEQLSEVPDGALVIFSAHGVSQSVQDQARSRSLKVLDATCPLVLKVHLEVMRHARDGRDLIVIGHAGHPEVEGTLGRYDGSQGGQVKLVESLEGARSVQMRNPDNLAYVTQTTLSVDDTRELVGILSERFPNIVGPKKADICYATQNRQDAVKDMLGKIDLLLIIGAHNSSNTNRLCELGRRAHLETYLIRTVQDIQTSWIADKQHIGISAGASAPEVLLQEVVAFLRARGHNEIVELPARVQETITFRLPKDLLAVEPKRV